MCSVTIFVLIVASIPGLCFGKKGGSSDPVDAVRAVANLPNLVLAVSGIDPPTWRCLTADLTSFDEDAGEATYTWHVKSPNSSNRTDVRLNYALTGEGPDMCVAYINDGARDPCRNSKAIIYRCITAETHRLWHLKLQDTIHKYACQVLYSDYKDCVLVRMLLVQKEVCFLWESKETAYAVPKNCLDAYKESCGDGVTLYSKDACNAY